MLRPYPRWLKHPMTLRDSFEQHRGRPVAKIDHFFDVYEAHLARFRGCELRLLEIGVDQGGSLELWQAYFGPGCEVHGVDINPQVASRAPEGARVHIGPQDDEVFLAGLVRDHGSFDIVIDDGSHLMAHQVATFNALYPTLSERGIYICEDAFTSYWKEYGGELRGEHTFMEFAKGLVDELHAFWATDAGAEPTAFTRMTRGIHFYSGAVVFEREAVREPVYVTRAGQGRTATSIADLKAAAGRTVGG